MRNNVSDSPVSAIDGKELPRTTHIVSVEPVLLSGGPHAGARGGGTALHSSVPPWQRP